MEIKEFIQESIDKAKELGWKIKSHSFYDEKSKECCPLGAVVVVNVQTDLANDCLHKGPAERARKCILDATGHNFSVWRFATGFDGGAIYGSDRDVKSVCMEESMGAEFRKELLGL